MAHARLGVDVALVYEAAADRSGTPVEVLVAAPHGKIRIGIVQRERQVADRVRQVDAGDAPVAVRGAHDARHVKCLAGAKLHPGPQHQRNLLTARRQSGLDGCLRHQVLTSARRELEQGGLGIKAAPGDLGCDRMPVGREGPGFHQDAGTPPLRAVETRQHEVQVRGQGVHGDDFGVARAGERGEARGEVLVIGNPRTPRMLVPLDSQARPVIEFLRHEVAGCERHESEGVAAQVRQCLALTVARQGEARAQRAQRIRGITGARVLQGGRLAHVEIPVNGYSSGRLGTASPPRAGTCSCSR